MNEFATPTIIYGEHDEATLQQMETVRQSGATHAVLCADGHLGYAHPIGGVAAYPNHVSLSGVGFDIGCGCGVYHTTLRVGDVAGRIDGILDAIQEEIPFGIGKRSQGGLGRKEWDRIKDRQEWDIPAVGQHKSLAESQLGTVGSGVGHPAW